MPDQPQDVSDAGDWTVIAQAEGILLARNHLTLGQASDLLRTGAAASGMSVAQHAEEIVHAQHAGTPGSG